MAANNIEYLNGATKLISPTLIDITLKRMPKIEKIAAHPRILTCW